jgi:ABC-type dipeptide/oligopeptide/nickel transport system ATPase component
VHELIDGIRRDLGCGVLIISHDIERAAQTGDDVVVLVPHEHDEKAGVSWSASSSGGGGDGGGSGTGGAQAG